MPRLKEVTHILADWMQQPMLKNDSKPAEVFDTHPLSEMIISSESEAGKSEHMILVENSWKSEWHKNGVQVPVHALDELRKPDFRKSGVPTLPRRLPMITSSDKLWHDEEDAGFDSRIHCIPVSVRRMPAYHLDNFDRAWLKTVNEERECLGETLINDWMLEEVIETLEHLTFLRMQEKIKELEGEALEFDENAKCDVCLSYEGEDGNELVFCDGCFLCVHQACYGITTLPEGSWICRRCEAGVKSTTPCFLCPNTGGAMKKADDGVRWCHISCALWVPEVGFGNVELMEPVIKLDNIPQARRSLLCCICRSRYGAPIQCYNKKCKVAFHVTCAFQSNLTMRQELIDKDVRLVGLCPKHTRKDQHHQSGRSPSKNLIRTTPVKSPSQSPIPSNCGSNHQTSIALRKQRLLELENDFHKLVTDPELVAQLSDRQQRQCNTRATRSDTSSTARKVVIPEDIRLAISAFWRLKRRANFNQPLVNPVPIEWRQTATEVVATTKEALAQAARITAEMQAFDAFRRIRFGLDRARLVLDMVLKRERRKLALFKRMSRISEIQLKVLLTGKRCSLTDEEKAFMSSAHLGDTVYDNAELLMACKCDPRSTAAFLPQVSEKEPHTTTGQSNTDKTEALSLQTYYKEDTKNTLNHYSPAITNSEETLNELSCDLSIIPRDQLIVSEDIKKRLRSALAIVSTNQIYAPTTVTPESKSLGLKKTATKGMSSSAFSGFQLSTLTRSKRTLSSGTPSENLFTRFNEDLQLSTPAKRPNRRGTCVSQSPTHSMLNDHTIPILSKFSTIRLGRGTVKFS